MVLSRPPWLAGVSAELPIVRPLLPLCELEYALLGTGLPSIVIGRPEASWLLLEGSAEPVPSRPLDTGFAPKTYP